MVKLVVFGTVVLDKLIPSLVHVGALYLNAVNVVEVATQLRVVAVFHHEMRHHFALRVVDYHKGRVGAFALKLKAVVVSHGVHFLNAVGSGPHHEHVLVA